MHLHIFESRSLVESQVEVEMENKWRMEMEWRMETEHCSRGEGNRLMDCRPPVKRPRDAPMSSVALQHTRLRILY